MEENLNKLFEQWFLNLNQNNCHGLIQFIEFIPLKIKILDYLKLVNDLGYDTTIPNDVMIINDNLNGICMEFFISEQSPKNFDPDQIYNTILSGLILKNILKIDGINLDEILQRRKETLYDEFIRVHDPVSKFGNLFN